MKSKYWAFIAFFAANAANADTFPPAEPAPPAATAVIPPQVLTVTEALSPTDISPPQVPMAIPAQPVASPSLEPVQAPIQAPVTSNFDAAVNSEVNAQRQELLAQPAGTETTTAMFPKTTNSGSPSTQAATPSNSASGGKVQQTMTVDEAAKNLVSPLTPDQIKELKGTVDQLSRAKQATIVASVPHISSMVVDLSPGASIPVVRVAAGRPTWIVFEDITGAPWPLAGEPINAQGKSKFFISWYTGTPTVYVQPKISYGNGDLGVVLQNLPVPINIVLANAEPDSTATSRVFDTRINIRIPKRGPMAVNHSVTSIQKIDIYNDTIQAILDGVPPATATRLKTDNAQAAVWKIDDKMYVRTRLETKSAFSSTSSSVDGTHVYVMDLTPFITLSDGGNSVTVKVNF